ncbi:LacI family DNA-binding transcriptional regulator [Paenibacillus flagellatus]|uniref:LacI family transcriptional regulator n=1 Tax=Paenibacillus flagellatus TaxID=2211139 RepID=A0A2V5KVD4_9BACL|nr:LacI family DNA-binding transcriptional regulator [Paenibacillus flagellatus]PYI53486.1 LacI family transcriptional regulator [Paenibacillus flagellatus]
MATIDDVARTAGVSKSTVSSVFSQKRPISKEVTERVLAAARQLDYKPNYWARSLANKTTRIIGLNMPGERVKFSLFHLSLLNGVLSECSSSGYRLLVNSLSRTYLDEVPHLAKEPVDGDILLDPVEGDVRIADRIRQKLPLVVIGRPSGEFESKVSYVDNDNVENGRQVTEYLLGLGHRRILFLNASAGKTVSADRGLGYRRALEQAGVPFDPQLLVHKDPNQTSSDFGYAVSKKAIAKHPDITAIITDTDKMAVGVYKAAAEAGIAIPGDLSVIAFSDETVFAAELHPPLTGVKLFGEELGREAAKLLIDQCVSGNRSVKRALIATEMVERGSCAAAPVRAATDH